MNGFAKRSLYSSLSGLAIVFASFVSGVIVANFLGVDGAGVVAFAVWIALVIAPVIDGGTALSVGRFTADLKGRDDKAAAFALPGRLARRLLVYNLLGVTALVGFYLVSSEASFDPLRASFSNMTAGVPANMALIVAVLVSLQAFATFGAAYLRGSQNFVLLAALTSISMVAQIICVYAGVHFYGIAGAIAGYAVGQVCLASTAWCLLWRQGNTSPDLAQQIRRYGRFSWAANVCNTFVWSRIEILFLQAFWGYREVGLFSVALALSGLASQGPLLLTGAFFPMFAEKHGQDDRAGLQAAFSSGTRLLALIAFPVCFGMAAIVPVLVGLLYGPAFEPAVIASMIIVTAAAFNITTVIGTHLVNALARSDFIFASSFVGAILSAAFGLLLIPNLGLVGAAAARAAVQLLMIGLGLWFITAKLQFSYPFGLLPRIILASLAAALAAFLIVSAIPNLIGLLAAITVAGPIYVTCLRVFGATHPDDILLARRLTAPMPRPIATVAGIVLSFVHPNSDPPMTSKITR